MKNEVFLLRDGWHVSFNGKTTGTWQEKVQPKLASPYSKKD
jgi:hypothetical protein